MNVTLRDTVREPKFGYLGRERAGILRKRMDRREAIDHCEHDDGKPIEKVGEKYGNPQMRKLGC